MTEFLATTIISILVLLASGICGVFWFLQNTRFSMLDKKIDELNAEIDQLYKDINSLNIRLPDEYVTSREYTLEYGRITTSIERMKDLFSKCRLLQ